MPITAPHNAIANRRQFWADKAANAAHCKAMDAKHDSALIIDWTQRFEIARAMAARKATMG